jgi:hypothetical protein
MAASFAAADEKVHILLLDLMILRNRGCAVFEKVTSFPLKESLINSFFVVPGSSANSPPSTQWQQPFSLELSVQKRFLL